MRTVFVLKIRIENLRICLPKNRAQTVSSNPCMIVTVDGIETARTRKTSNSSQPTLLNIPLDEPSCSEETPAVQEESGTRRARSVTTSRRSLFFGREKGEMLNQLALLKNELQKPAPMFELEDSWKDIVPNFAELSEKAQRQQAAIWEFVTTERTYMQMLKQMHELYLYLRKLQEHGFLQEIDPQRVFLNYSELYDHNSKFWRRSVLPMLRNTRERGVPLNPCLLKAGFDKIDEWWPSYANFLYGNPDCYAYVQKCQKDSELFREFVLWAESQDAMQKNRQRLSDALMNPMQRLTRYSLLLRAVYKHSVDENERDNLSDMIARIERATHDVEETMINSDLLNKLNELSKSIESYDVVDSEEFEKIFPIKCDIRLSDPMPFFFNPPQFRRIFLRSDLKLRDGKQGPKVDTHCILFTDLFLICKTANKRNDKLRILKPPIHIAKMCLQPYPDSSGFAITAMNDFGMPTCLYYFYPPSIEETKKWLEMIKVALREFSRLNPLNPQSHLIGYPYAAPNGLLSPEVNCFSDHIRGSSNNSCGYSESFNGVIPDIVHRKCASMDSQILVEQSQLAGTRRINQVSSADNLDRLWNGNRYGTNLLSRQKLTVPHSGAQLTASYVGQSKSSVDLHLTPHLLDPRDSPKLSRCSRSNSSGILERSDAVDDGSSTHEISDLKGSVENAEDSPGAGEVDSVSSVLCRREVRTESPTMHLHPISQNEKETNENVQPTGRRFERRYHTSDGIDVMKQNPKVLKRFSWNVASAVGGSSRKISSRFTEQQSRRHSQSTVASSESFSSSTSGISTSSSNMDDTTIAEDNTPTEEIDFHISTISIGEHQAPISENGNMLRINLLEEQINKFNINEANLPPLPTVPPPAITIKEKEHKSANKHKELLKFIMDNQLETS